MKTKNLLTLFVLLAGVLTTRAQDTHFSQFFEAPLLRNPSLAGIFTGDVRVQGVYRDQWNSITNAYRTGSFNVEYKMPIGRGDDFLTTGLQVLYDKAGTVGLTTTNFLPALNYHKSLSDEKTSYLSLGFIGGMVRRSIDMSKVTTNSQYNGGYSAGAPTGETFTVPYFTTWDAGVGMSFNTSFGMEDMNSFFGGVAYHHLNKPKNSFYENTGIELIPKTVISTGIKMGIDEFSSLTIQADHSIQGNVNETIGGALYSYNLGDYSEDVMYTVHAGAFLRWKDAFVPVVKMDMQNLSVALSYDINISQLKTASQGRGGYELSVSWVGFLDRDNSARDKVLCPRF
jgi:type IX secretion system PorP/SprF family membrane protein